MAAETEPKPIEPFLTIKVYDGTSGCDAEIPELGIGLSAQTPDEARKSLMAIAVDQSKLLVRMGLSKYITPERMELARRVVEIPEARIAEIFKQT